MDTSLYMRRIGYEGALKPSDSTLCALQRAHLRTIPFENLDIHLGKRISLDLADLFDKIIVRRRGGFCYELNGLFAFLLEELGFDVTCLSASDAYEDGGFGPEFDHLTLLVISPLEPGVRRLVDVGWGDSFCEPLLLDERGEQEQDGRAYRIDHDGDYRLLWQRDYDGRWERQYRFTLCPRNYTDFAGMCQYHQTSPDSPFVRKRICTLATADGRITLDNTRLITTVRGQRREQTIDDEEAYRRILKEIFNIEL